MQDFVSQLGLKSGQRVLDVGCGIGGGDFYMAAEHGVSVHGIDLSVNMVLIAIERAGKVPGGASVSFEIADCTLANYPPQSFDVIYSRDTILHIQDKPALFKKFAEWLKPGGKILISDYCRSPEKPSGSFAKYIAQRGYDLHSVAGYGKMIEEAGFVKVQADDRTWQVSILVLLKSCYLQRQQCGCKLLVGNLLSYAVLLGLHMLGGSALGCSFLTCVCVLYVL